MVGIKNMDLVWKVQLNDQTDHDLECLLRVFLNCSFYGLVNLDEDAMPLLSLCSELFILHPSNRAAAFLNLVKLQKALSDAETTISLNPSWEKVPK